MNSGEIRTGTSQYDEVQAETFSDRFHEAMVEQSAQTIVAALREHILPLSEGLCDQLQKGITKYKLPQNTINVYYVMK